MDIRNKFEELKNNLDEKEKDHQVRLLLLVMFVSDSLRYSSLSSVGI